MPNDDLEPTNDSVLELANEHRFWRRCTAVFGGFAVLKGIRLPGTWAATQAQFDYRHGFIKRGLMGEVVHLIGGNRYRTLCLLFFAELAVFTIVLIVLARRSKLEERFGSNAILALFASSYGVTYLVHLVGYTDIVCGLIAMCLLLVRNLRGRFWLSTLLVPVALLVHENFLFMFFPVVLFSFFLDGLLANDRSVRTRASLFTAVLGVEAVGVTALLALHSSLTPGQANRFGAEIATRTDFVLRPDYFETLSSSLQQNVRLTLAHMHRAFWWRDLVVSGMTLGPIMLLLVQYVSRLLGLAPKAGDATAHRWTTLATGTVLAAPLLLYGLGWDCARWNVICLFSGFLVLSQLSLQMPGGRVPFTTWDRNAVVFLMAVNMASGFGFFDAFNVTPYPFFPEMVRWLRGA